MQALDTRNFKVFPLLLVLFSLSVLSGCSGESVNSGADKIENWASDESKKSFTAVQESEICVNKGEVVAELGVPGKISGFDCVTENDKLQIAYREFEDTSIGLHSLSSWNMPMKEGYRAIVGKNWYAIYNVPIKGIKDEEASFDFFGEREYEKEDDALVCSQEASAFVYEYAYSGIGIPSEVNPELAKLIEDEYASMRSQHLKNKYSEGSGELTRIIGNASEKVNLWCAEHKEAY